MAKRLWLIASAVGLAVAAGAGTLAAQNSDEPSPISSGTPVNARLEPAEGHGSQGRACYAIATSPGDRVTVTLSSSDFQPTLEIGRGALCSDARLQHRSAATPADWTVSHQFAAAGGRYLIFVEADSVGAEGDFILTVTGASAAQSQSLRPLDRQARMAAEAAAHERKLAQARALELQRQAAAAAQAAQLAALERQWAAEEAAYADYDSDYDEDYAQPATQNMFAGVLGGFARGLQQGMESNARLEAQFDGTRAMIADLQAQEARRQAAQARAQEQERLSAIAREAERRSRAAAAAAEQAARRANDIGRTPAAAPAQVNAGSGFGAGQARQCTSEPITGTVRSLPKQSRSEAEAYIRATPLCRAPPPLDDLRCEEREESVIDSSCLTSVRVCPKRTVWVCTASYTCAERRERCTPGGGASAQ